MESPRRQSAAASASGSSLSNEGRLSGPSTDWEEPCWPEFLFTIKEAEYSLNLEVPLSTKPRRLLRKQFSRRFYHLVGLSPNCKLAFVLEEHGAHIYFLKEPPNLRAELRAELSVELLQPSKGEVLDAVLSNRYFATVDRYKLDTFQLDAGGCLRDRHFSTALENQANGSSWVPTCLTIFDDVGDRTWVAVGFRVKKGLGNGGDIKIYLVEASGITEEIGRYDKVFRSTIARPLESEYIRRIAFSPDGDRLACVTNNNTVLIWSWSDRGKAWRPPFEIRREFSPDAGGKGTLTSVALFKSPSGKPYVLCTTSPSSERGRTGEWSFISPVPPRPALVPMETQHSIQLLRDSVLVGAATSVGDLIAVLETSGIVRLLRLDRGRDGGLRCHTSEHAALKFDERLSRQESAAPTSLKFQETLSGLHLFAIDLYGKLIVKTVMKGAYPPLITSLPLAAQELDPSPLRAELGSQPVLRTPGNQIIYQLEDSVAPNRNAHPPHSQHTRTSPVISPVNLERPLRRSSLP